MGLKCTHLRTCCYISPINQWLHANIVEKERSRIDNVKVTREGNMLVCLNGKSLENPRKTSHSSFLLKNKRDKESILWYIHLKLFLYIFIPANAPRHRRLFGSVGDISETKRATRDSLMAKWPFHRVLFLVFI